MKVSVIDIKKLHREKLEFTVVTYSGNFIFSPPILWRIGLNVLHYRSVNPIIFQKSGET